MITKEEFTQYITEFQKFDEAIERIEIALNGSKYGCNLWESDWYGNVSKMLDIFIDSHFTEKGADWVYYYLFENIDDKKVIISDRSFISSLAYQEPADWISVLNKYAKKPDLLLLLDLDVKTSVSRTSGEDTFENEEFLTNVKSNYLELVKDYNHEIINANNGINKVSSDIKKAVASHVGLCRDCIL
jgi:thymidylate kinase